MKKSWRLSDNEIIGIYLAPGLRKCVAMDFNVSMSLVCMIKSGRRRPDVIRQYHEAAAVNADLVFAAFQPLPEIAPSFR